MEYYYNLFMKVILKEINKFQLDTEVYSTYVNQLTSSLDQNFDVPYNRCAFMYKYGTNNVYFFKDCIGQFLLDYSNAKDLLREWKSHTEVKVCSLSVGPALDYLAFVVAILEYDPLPPNFTGAKIISQHGAWRNTVNFLLEVLKEQDSIFDIPQSKLNYESVNVIQADFLTYYSGKFAIASLSDAHIVLMVRTLNLKASGDPQEGPLLQMLKVLISSMRSDVTIFCIDTKPSLALFTQAFSNFPGRFLYGPIHRMTTCTVDFPEVFGSRPTVTSRGAFFVWQKLSNNASISFLNATSSTEFESNLKVVNGCGDDKSTLSNPSSIEDESEIVHKDSGNLRWIELKTYWKSSSPKTKKLLKELMLLDKETLETIEDFISHSEKVDNGKNIPVNITGMKRLDGAEPYLSQKAILPIVGNLKNMTDCSNTLVEDNSFDDNDRSLPTDTDDSASSLNENITLPGIIEVNTSVLSSGEKPSNYDAPAKIDSIKTKSVSEDYTFVEDVNARISSQEKVILTNSHESTNSTTIKELTDHIRQLASSLDSMTQPNEPSDDKICNGLPNNSHRQHMFPPKSTIHDVPFCSKYSHSYRSTERSNLPSYDCTVEKKAFQCIDCHFRCQCCHNQCNLMQCNCQSSCCHFKPCCSHPVPRCLFSCSRLSSGGNFEDTTSPNIVIPLQNISEDALLKIVAVLKSDRKFC